MFEVAHLNNKAVSAYESSTSKPQSIKSKVPPKMLRLFALYENMTNFVFPLCSALPDRPYPETPVSQSSNIVDISKVGLKQFWNLKSHMQDASQLATAYYPETLDRIFIIGAPSFFPTVWGWIKRWFDPITVSKIFILNNANMKATLEQHIAIENIPKKYGGKLDYEFGQLPNLEPGIDETFKWAHPEHQMGHRTFPTGPIRWQRGPDAELVAVAVGTEKGQQRHVRIGSVQQSDRIAHAPLAAGRQDDALKLYRTTSGKHTQPDSPPPGYEEEHYDDDHSSSSEKASDSAQGASYTIPVHAGPGSTMAQQEITPTISGEGVAAQRQPAAPQQQPASAQPAFSSAQTQPTTLKPAYTSDLTQPAISSAPSQPTFSSAPSQPATSSAPPPEDAAPVRQGTSSTRFQQQAHTLADGNEASDTPNMRSSGDGDSHGVMEPNTIGQAPKEHPVPEAEEPPAPSYLDQAKGLAGQAYAAGAGAAGAALKVVGLGGQGEAIEESAQKEAETTNHIPDDPAVDQTKERNVEEFLRSQYPSKAAQKKEEIDAEDTAESDVVAS